MRTKVLLFLLLFLGCTLAAQTPGGTGIVYGEHHAFSITAPEGWVLDNTSGREQDLHAVFYEEGSSWAKAETVMYANTAVKVPGARTLDELLAYDEAQFRKRSAKLRVTVAKDIRTKSGTSTVRRFEGDVYGNYEAVAYIDEKKTVVMLVLSARTEAGFLAAYPDFEKLVAGYEFLTDQVEPSRGKMAD
ncbi:MAG TPA: hypothetical protein VF111_10680 [Thermoanaerobaculia bacterium]